MSTTKFTTSSGRKVDLEVFKIRGTYLGVYAGDAEKMREELLRQIPRSIERNFSTQAFTVFVPKEGPLPRFTCFAELNCLVPLDAKKHGSSLVVVWFEKDFPVNLTDVLHAAIDGIDWEKSAKDYLY